jgi:hypothetical protein
MEDFFCEKTVKRDHGKKGILFPVFSIIALVIFLVFLNGVPIIFGINIIYFTGMVSFGLCYLLYKLIKKFDYEYQIEITNDSFEVSKITNKKHIDVLASFSLKDADYIGSVTSDRFKDDLSKAEFSLNCTSLPEYSISDDVWYITVNQERTQYIVIFEFDEQMYPIFRRFNPRGTQNHAT